MYKKTTHDIAVYVDPEYLEEHSDPDNHDFFWAYTIRLKNESDDTVQLVNRYWKITDAQGRTSEVRGAGVVGEQPVLKPGEEYEYTSGCPLKTSSGFMSGKYQMMADGGEIFDIDVPAFSLDSPFSYQMAN